VGQGHDIESVHSSLPQLISAKPASLNRKSGLGGTDAGVSASESCAVKYISCRDSEDPGDREPPIDIVHNTCMEQLSLRTQLGPRIRMDYTWIYSLMSRISSRKLHTISLVFDVRKEHHENILDEVLDVFDAEHYSLIDNLLSKAQFWNLKKVDFWVWADADCSMPDQEQWFVLGLSSRLPKLYARRILHAYISVPHYWDGTL